MPHPNSVAPHTELPHTNKNKKTNDQTKNSDTPVLELSHEIWTFRNPVTQGLIWQLFTDQITNCAILLE